MMRSWLQANAVSCDEAFDVLVAATEAYSNAVQHAYGLVTGTIEINAAITGDELRIAVKDRGTWRSRPACSNDGGGRGLTVMRALMDAVEIESGDAGTEVRMRRALKVPING